MHINKLKEDVMSGRFPELDFLPLTTALYGQPRPDEGNGFRECFTLHQGPPVLATGPKTALAMEMQGTLTAAPFLGTQHVHFPGPQEHMSAGKSCRVSPTSATTKDTISGKVLLTLGVSR